jgi:hypothetical protein
MATTTRSPLTEQAEKLQNLARHLSDGRLLEPVLRMAQTGDVWSGAIHEGFLSWMQFALDGWVRNQLAQGVRLVAESLANRAAEIERAAQASVASGGQVAMAPLPPPAPLNYSPGRPPEFGDIGGRASNNKFNNERMKELARLLEIIADGAVIDFARSLRDALEPPPAPPLPPGAPPFISPLPPDAAVAAGDPGSASPGANAYLALADELHKAADDIERRVRQLSVFDEPLPTAIVDPNLIDAVGAGAAAAVEGSSQAGSGSFIGPPAPTRSLADRETARKDGAAAAAEVGKIVGAKRWDDEDHEKLFLALNEAEKHVDDPEYAVAFMKSLVPDGLTAWCKLMNNSVIDVQIEMDVLRPMSRLFATASHQGDQFPAETRNALFNSRCLDTLVHYGNFDKQFTLDVYHRIMDDPGRYERSDGSERVYAQTNLDGKYRSGDARVGAYRMLANNPDAAQLVAESLGESGRHSIWEGLEEDGPVGDSAAAALQAGLHDLNREASENTLEVVLKKVAANELDLKGPGKRGLAQILSTEDAITRMAVATSRTKEGFAEGKSDEKGFRVSSDTLEDVFGKILDDKHAHAEFVNRLWSQTSVLLHKQVEAPVVNGSPEDPLGPLLDEIGLLGNFFQTVTQGAHGAADEKDANIFAVAGLKKALTEALEAIPVAGVAVTVATTAAETQGGAWIDEILSDGEKERIKNLDAEGLSKELERYLRPLAAVSIFGNPALVKQLLPPGSPEAERFSRWVHYAPDGSVTIEDMAPKAPGKNEGSMNDLLMALADEGHMDPPSGLGKAIRSINDKVEIYKPERGG